jgi:hypothetical protein
MTDAIQFCGLSGICHRLRLTTDASWARVPGVVVFAARDTCGWRAIDVREVTGAEDIRLFWRWREAQRFGATHVFTLAEGNTRLAADIATDLVDGLRPVARLEFGRRAA